MVLNICHGIRTAASSWPNASTTGSSGALTAVPGTATSGTGWAWNSGDHVIYVTGSGVTVSNLDSDGAIVVQAANVTISNCRVVHDDSVGIFTDRNGTTVTDCTVTGSGTSAATGMSGVRVDGGTSFVVRRCNISGCENGIFIGALAALVEDNYIHDLLSEDLIPTAHTDGIQLVGSNECDGTTVQHNAVYSVHNYATSALIMSTSANITITNNRFRGGYSTIQIWRDSTNVFTNNRFGDLSDIPGGVLATDDGGTGDPTWTGNVNDDTEASIPKWW